MAGFKRLFSSSRLSISPGPRQIGLLGAVATPGVANVIGKRPGLDRPPGTLALTQSLAVQVLGVVVAILALVAAADYLFQYRQWFERQKMSLQELKEEFKQTEGDPAVKGKIRQIRQTRARKRMMAAVAKASVVITNPTHYAVALQYERGMNAPICVAKGTDLIARKIRAVAAEHNIDRRNPPACAHAPRHRRVDQILPEHCRAVAEIICHDAAQLSVPLEAVKMRNAATLHVGVTRRAR